MITESLINRIDAVLPQTQCTKCGFDGCRPYAEALANGQTTINRCPPGGRAGIEKLASVLETPVLPLDETCGEEGPLMLAVIDEAHCIGCTLCIKACPVDAIIGANKFMHTVIPALCTGCDLCIPPCPVDCIDLVPAKRDWTPSDANASRQRHIVHKQRVLQQQQANEARLASATLSGAATPSPAQADSPASAPASAAASLSPEAAKKAAIAQALQRARARRQNKTPTGTE